MPSGVMTRFPVARIRSNTSLASSDTKDERINSLHIRCSCKGSPWTDGISPRLMRSKTLTYILNVMFELLFWVVAISGSMFIGWFARC